MAITYREIETEINRLYPNFVIEAYPDDDGQIPLITVYADTDPYNIVGVDVIIAGDVVEVWFDGVKDNIDLTNQDVNTVSTAIIKTVIDLEYVIEDAMDQ